MYHSLNFEMLPPKIGRAMKFNTYKDLFLVPTSRPVINPPTVKTKQIEVPGANGIIDLTESLTPYPVYNNRQGSIEFAVLNEKKLSGGKEMQWQTLYSKILNMIHGRRAKVILEDDPGWYYEGRWAVNNWTSNADGTWSNITLDYDLYPYKLSVYDSIEGGESSGTDRWKWDPFSFVDGVIYDQLVAANWTDGTPDGFFKNIPVNSTSWKAYGIAKGTDSLLYRDQVGWMPVSPVVTFSTANMGIRITNAELGYAYEKTYTEAGTYTDPACLLYDWTGDGFHVFLKGTGNVTIAFRRGSL